MEFLSLYGKEIFSIFIVLLTWVLNNRLKEKAKLSYGFQHGFTFLIQEPLYDANGELIFDSQLVYTQSIILVNEGREGATKVTLVFNYKPMYINFWPAYPYEESLEKDKRYIVMFENLVPNDPIRCEILSINQPAPEILSIKSKECRAVQVDLIMQKAISKVFRRFCIFLLLLGMGTLTYLITMLLQWLVTKTG